MWGGLIQLCHGSAKGKQDAKLAAMKHGEPRAQHAAAHPTQQISGQKFCLWCALSEEVFAMILSRFMRFCSPHFHYAWVVLGVTFLASLTDRPPLGGPV